METGDPGQPAGPPEQEQTPRPPAYPGWGGQPPPPPGYPAGGAQPPPPGYPGWGGQPPPPPPGWGAPPPPAYPGWNAAPGGYPAYPQPYAPPPPPGAVPGWNPDPYGRPAPSGSGSLRPRGVGELLDGAFTLYRRNFLLLVAIAALVQVPFALLQLLVFELAGVGNHLSSLQDLTRTLPNQGGVLTPEQSSQLAGDVGATLAYFAIVLVVQFLVVYPLSLAATTSAVSARYLDQPATVAASYRAALGRIRALIAMVLWLVLIVAGGLAVTLLFSVVTGATALAILALLATFVVYVVLLVRTTVAPQAIVLEKLSGWKGIQRSWALSTGSGWRILGIRTLLTIIQVLVSYVVILPLGAVTGGADLGTQQLVTQVGQAVTAVFVAPITLVTLTLLYYDLRIRREGFDIEMLAASL
jgi:hypothetical protein